MVKEYIYVNENSLSNDLCDEMINKFQIEKINDNTYKGVTSSCLNMNVKDTKDFQIEKLDQWKDIRKCLEFELLYNLKKYAKQVNKSYSDIHKLLLRCGTYYFRLFRFKMAWQSCLDEYYCIFQ